MADWAEGVPNIEAEGVVALDMEALRVAAPGLERNLMEVLTIEVYMEDTMRQDMLASSPTTTG